MSADKEQSVGVMPGPSLSGTNLERAGDHNQRATLHAIRIGGWIDRGCHYQHHQPLIEAVVN